MTTSVRPRSLPLSQPWNFGKSHMSRHATVRAPAPAGADNFARQPSRVFACADGSAASPLRFDAMSSRSLLSKLPTDDNLDLWRHFARDPDMGVRQAVASMGPAAVWPGLCDDPSPWVRQAVARRVAASPEHQTLAAAQRHDVSLWVRLAGVEGLSGQVHGAKLLLAYLDDAEPLVRASALQALNTATPTAKLTELAVHDPVDWVRHMALRQLALRDPQAARQAFRQLPAASQGTLASVLQHFAPMPWQLPAAAIMRRAFNTLLRPMDSLPPQIIYDLLLHPHTAAADKMVETKHAALVSKAVRGLAHPRLLDSDAPAAHALFLLHQPQQADAIGRAMYSAPRKGLDGALSVVEMLRSSPNPYARRMAAQLLTKLPQEPVTLPMLEAQLLDADGEVRFAAASALESVCPQLPDSKACLSAAQYLCAAPDHRLRARGLQLLQHIGTDETLPSLLEVYRHEKSASTRSEAVRALTQHPSPDAVPLLQEVACDPDPTVRARLAEFLEQVSFKRAYGVLLVLAHDAYPEVREVVTHTLCVHAKAQDEVVSEEALRLLDTMDRVANPVVSRLRSTVLPEALVAFQDNPEMRTMLHGWVHRLDSVHLGVLKRLAQSGYPDRDRLLLTLLDSPHQAVADEARGVISERLNLAFGADPKL